MKALWNLSVRRHLYFWSWRRKHSACKGGSLAEEKGGEIPKELIDCLFVYRNNHAPSEVWSNTPREGVGNWHRGHRNS